MTEVKRIGDEQKGIVENQKRMGDHRTALKNDVDGAKNFIGGVITLSGCSGAVATVVMTIDARIKEGKEERRRGGKLAEEEKRSEAKLAEEEKRREAKQSEEDKAKESRRGRAQD